MKKIISILLIFVLTLSTFVVFSSANDKINVDPFLTNGKLLPPEDIYVNVYPFDGSSHQTAKKYLTQSDDMMRLVSEWENNEENFNEKYGFIVEDLLMQHDCKLDDGPWHYEAGWDEFEYDYSVLPNYMCLYPSTPALFNKKIVSNGYNIDLYYLEEDGSDWGFFKDVVTVKEGEDENIRVLDLENHTLSFRSRYILTVSKMDNEGNTVINKCFSDWSTEVSIGKNGNQAELKAPGKLDAPILSNMKEDGKNDTSVSWDVTWEISDNVFLALKYFWIMNDAFQPVYCETQYRVNGGEWTNTTIANAADIYGGHRGFYTGEEAKKDDTVEFRARLVCSEDESKTSEWSNIVSNKAPELDPSESPEPGSTNEPKDTNRSETKKSKCKLCGICPVQPLGICLFVWIAIILIIIIVVIIIILKSRKKEDIEKNNKK